MPAAKTTGSKTLTGGDVVMLARPGRSTVVLGAPGVRSVAIVVAGAGAAARPVPPPRTGARGRAPLQDERASRGRGTEPGAAMRWVRPIGGARPLAGARREARPARRCRATSGGKPALRAGLSHRAPRREPPSPTARGRATDAREPPRRGAPAPGHALRTAAGRPAPGPRRAACDCRCRPGTPSFTSAEARAAPPAHRPAPWVR